MAATDEVSNKPPLPSYSEMIVGAIEALDEKAGSNKSAISKYIESKYAEQLPEAHWSLLAAHLERMKESGEILMVKNNYMKPGPDTPLKRGRGRPPKPKTPGSVPSSPRPRGRPPKTNDPLAAALAKAAGGLPRPRGRPPKKARAEDGDEKRVTVPTPSPARASGTPGVKRGRGRPPKVKPPFADVGFA